MPPKKRSSSKIQDGAQLSPKARSQNQSRLKNQVTGFRNQNQSRVKNQVTGTRNEQLKQARNTITASKVKSAAGNGPELFPQPEFIDPEISLISNYTGFAVRIRMNRRGEKKLSTVSMVGRVPTNYFGKGQGPHIVANAFLLYALENMLSFQDINVAIQNLIDFTHGIPNPPKSLFRDVWIAADGKEERVKNQKFTAADVINSLKALKQRSNTNFIFVDFDSNDIENLPQLREEFQSSEKEVKKAVRQRQTIVRTDLAFVTSNVVRLWNKRKCAVWDEGANEEIQSVLARLLPPLSLYDFPDGRVSIGDQEKQFATELQGGNAEKRGLEIIRNQRTLLLNEPQENPIDAPDPVYAALALLIDIRPAAVVPKNLKTEFKQISTLAVTEALRLCKWAFYPVNVTFDPKKLNEALDNKDWQK